MKGNTIALAISSLLIISSCESGLVDTTPPSIEVIEYIPAASQESICGSLEPEVFVLEGGDSFIFDVIFEDNEALSQYKIDIHNNFDCHGHGGGSAPSITVPGIENQTIDWTELIIRDLSGTSMPINGMLHVPENVTAGNYHFHLQVVDESGNDSPSTNFFSMKITNSLDKEIPEIIVDEPMLNTFTVQKGENIRFKGQVKDSRSLSDGGNGILYLAYTDLSSGNSFSSDQIFTFDESVDTLYDFDFDYTIPQTLVTGNYRFSLGANDGVRNVASFVFFEVEVRD